MFDICAAYFEKTAGYSTITVRYPAVCNLESERY